MNKIFIYLIVFLCSVSLALAVSVVTDKTAYSGNEKVTISINQCSGISVVKIINPSNLLVDIKGGTGDGVFSYNTISDSADGKYKVTANCTNGAAEAFFCVDAPTCLVVTPAVQPPASTGPAGQPAAGSGGSGGGAGCVAKWDCYSWSYCDVNLKQTRTCVDLNKCQQAKKETQSCAECEESWVCSAWSECSNDHNYRTCDDEHACETTVSKPGLQKLCTEEEAFGPAPVYVSPVISPPYYAPPVEKESFWKENLFYLIMIPLVIIAIIIVILLTFHFLKPKRLAYNLNELKQWVRKERAMGTSDVDIRAILKEHTGWRDEEINQALENPQQRKGE